MVTMGQRGHALERIERVGGHPALDFVNTVDRWEDGRPGAEYLPDYAALEHWHALTDLLGTRAMRPLGGGSSAARRKAWRQALELREVLHRLFDAVASNRPPPQADLDALQSTLTRTAPWRRLTTRGRTVILDWNFRGAPPSALLGPVAWAAADLLERGPVDRIKACPPGDGCGWLFLDLSKNRSRTWCSMKTCGNLAKVRRFRAQL